MENRRYNYEFIPRRFGVKFGELVYADSAKLIRRTFALYDFVHEQSVPARRMCQRDKTKTNPNGMEMNVLHALTTALLSYAQRAKYNGIGNRVWSASAVRKSRNNRIVTRAKGSVPNACKAQNEYFFSKHFVRACVWMTVGPPCQHNFLSVSQCSEHQWAYWKTIYSRIDVRRSIERKGNWSSHVPPLE